MLYDYLLVSPLGCTNLIRDWGAGFDGESDGATMAASMESDRHSQDGLQPNLENEKNSKDGLGNKKWTRRTTINPIQACE